MSVRPRHLAEFLQIYAQLSLREIRGTGNALRNGKLWKLLSGCSMCSKFLQPATASALAIE